MSRQLKLECNPVGTEILKHSAEGMLRHAYIVGNAVLCTSKIHVNVGVHARHYIYDPDRKGWFYEDHLTSTARQILGYLLEQGMDRAVIQKSTGLLLAAGTEAHIARPTHVWMDDIEDWVEVQHYD